MTDSPGTGKEDDGGGRGDERQRRNVSTGSLRPALTFGFVAATVQMALLLWLLYC